MGNPMLEHQPKNRFLIQVRNTDQITLMRPRVLVQEMHPTVLPWKAPRNAMMDSFFPSPTFSFEFEHSSSVTLSVPRSRFINALKTVLNA